MGFAELETEVRRLRERVQANEEGIRTNTPTGVIATFAGATAPSGWLLCDGSAVSRTTYAALFATIGTTYGAGNGSTTFNLPNLKGRVPVGRDGAQSEFDTLGETGGAKTHTLSVAEIPAHSHKRGDIVGNATPNNPGNFIGSPGTSVFYSNGTGGYTADARGTDETGGGGAHNNLQPYLVLNHIIKA